MSIKATHRINRKTALYKLKRDRITVYENDCNERLADLLEEKECVNYEVVDFEKEDEPLDDTWKYWIY